MDYRYKIGEAVVVRSDLNTQKRYNMTSGPFKNDDYNYATPEMEAMKGRIVHIKSYCMGEYEVREISTVCWTDEMFEESNLLYHGLM